MAGEWIKVTTNLPTKPEVFKLARLIGENADTTVGLLFRFWCWADLITVDGVVDGVVDADVDHVVDRKGFCAALVESGWLEMLEGGEGIRIPNFERHNGESAKKRALKSERQARWRAGSVDAAPTTKRLQERLPEKRREEKITTKPLRAVFTAPSGFTKFWDAWPKSPRKVGKAACIKKWQSFGLEEISTDVIAHLELIRSSKQWRDGFEPAPLTYLNQRRWEDGAATDRAEEKRFVI